MLFSATSDHVRKTTGQLQLLATADLFIIIMYTIKYLLQLFLLVLRMNTICYNQKPDMYMCDQFNLLSSLMCFCVYCSAKHISHVVIWCKCTKWNIIITCILLFLRTLHTAQLTSCRFVILSYALLMINEVLTSKYSISF